MSDLEQITAEAIRDRAAEHGYAMAMDTASDLAAMVLAAQREAGYAVVQLPKSDRNGCWRADHWDVLPPDAGTPAFDIGVDASALGCADVRAFGLALLAAAEAAEGAQR